MGQKHHQDISRIAGFYKYPVSERQRLLLERGVLSEEHYRTLADQAHLLKAEEADRLVENVIGTFSLPLGVGLNFRVNGKDYVVPMVVEEPSILAAVSAAAKLAREGGGFQVQSTEPILIGQLQVVGCPQPLMARNAVLQAKQEILDLANSLHPRMAARGGGAVGVEVRIHAGAASRGLENSDMLIVHVLVDTRDAMGANMVNSMCEGLAPLIESLTGGQVFLRILSNLTDRAMVRARAIFPKKFLANERFSGEQVRDGIILASDFAACDPYRAATHNKGIMNGIDAVAIATGNDWRAIEAAAHAYAGRGESYTSLTRWSRHESGDLLGEIELPLKVGTVGGPVQSNPAIRIVHHILRIESARELAELMGAVGLAQNFAALRALSTEGIQRGHMSLHARNVAAASGAPPALFEQVVKMLIESGEIKIWKAKEIIESLSASAPGSDAGGSITSVTSSGPTETVKTAPEPERQCAHGRIILFGEHAVLYGARALAASIPLAVEARCSKTPSGGIRVRIRRWNIDESVPKHGEPRDYLQRSMDLITRAINLRDQNMLVEMFPHVPRAMSLGSSAALSVAAVRAIADCFDQQLRDEQISALAYQCDKLFHGTPSGLDNTIATYGQTIVFRQTEVAEVSPVRVPKPIPLVIGITGIESLTARSIARVQQGRENNPARYEKVFQEIDALTVEGVDAIQRYDLHSLGELMNFNHGLLNAMHISSPELEQLVLTARNNGALGAKLTGGGNGGAMIALCPDDGGEIAARVAAAMRTQGFQALLIQMH